MPYCKNCGYDVSDGAASCPNCGILIEAMVKKVLTNWGERFVAWIIDIILLALILSPIKFVVWTTWPSFIWMPNLLRWIPFVDFGLDNVIQFIYWMVLEGLLGQSIGKMFMNIEVTQLNGEPINIIHATIGGIGKAFLLPLDCIIGWMFYARNKQRLFNYISGTIIIKKRHKDHALYRQ
ncbi:MAG: RDD family protein [Candidatus Bathyarchaeota archaeon]|nr:MAG: RDD family protein [Candidatus Bathyarchaeota archaeon]